MKTMKATINGKTYEAQLEEVGGSLRTFNIMMDGKTYQVQTDEAGSFLMERGHILPSTGTASGYSEGTSAVAQLSVPAATQTAAEPKNADAAENEASEEVKGSVKAGVTGKVFKIEVAEGQTVTRETAIIILEAMKMEIPVVANADGTIRQILVGVGDPVEAGQVLAVIE